mmetsp:Transcript_31420/g.83645  ORF Transcript_31420/g.83645 Transcript_31420/m.83645 type:complete len:202 (-) Transcript_31420:227-832(-)
MMDRRHLNNDSVQAVLLADRQSGLQLDSFDVRFPDVCLHFGFLPLLLLCQLFSLVPGLAVAQLVLIFLLPLLLLFLTVRDCSEQGFDVGGREGPLVGHVNRLHLDSRDVHNHGLSLAEGGHNSATHVNLNDDLTKLEQVIGLEVSQVSDDEIVDLDATSTSDEEIHVAQGAGRPAKVLRHVLGHQARDLPSDPRLDLGVPE